MKQAGIFLLFVFCISFSACNNNESKRVDFSHPGSVKNRVPVLIAHRGGVVTEQTPECSLAAIRLAKEQGYSMVELDLRQSRDNIPVIFHDANMKKACGLDKSIKDLNVAEILTLSYSGSEQKICTFEQALELCKALGLGLMLDIKIKSDRKFFDNIATLVKKYGLENSCLTINTDPLLQEQIKSVALLPVSQNEFKKIQQGTACDLQGKFWFGLPHQLPDNMVQPLQQNGAFVFPAINTFRYPQNDHFNLARKDIQRLNKAGVDGYQIDSVYSPLFSEANEPD